MEKFIDKILQTEWDDLTPEAILSAKKVLLDTISAMIAGANEQSTQDLINQLGEENKGTYAIVGSQKLLTKETAAFINGTASVAIEMDEGNQWSKGHPAAHVVPALLVAVQQYDNFDGKKLLTLLIKAYELSSRFGRATTLKHDAHAHGTWGVLGAAATVLLFQPYSLEKFIAGLNISATFAMPTKWDAALEGALIRNVYVGNAIQQAFKTNDLLQVGFEAPSENIEYVYSKVIGTQFDKEKFTEPSNSWDIEKNYFKDHAFCRYAHAPLDAYKLLVEENNISTDEIKEINVQTYNRAATLHRDNYHNALSAKFSIPYALAVWTYTKKSDHSIFATSYLQDETIRALANKVNVQPSEEMEKNYPTIMPAEVEIVLNSGERFNKRLDLADSGLGSGVSFEHLANKFKSLTPHYTTETQNEIITFIEQLDEITDVSPLINLLRQA